MIAIIGAQDEEIRAIKTLMTNLVEKQLHHYQCFLGKINQQEVILAKSEVGGVACSVLMTLLFTSYPISFVYNVGTAGSYKQSNTKVYDVIVAEQLGYYDTDLTLFSHYQYGQMADCPRFFSSDSEIIKKVKSITWPFTVRYGTILSGDKFVTLKQDVLQTIQQHFAQDNVLAFDMESTYFAQTCYLFKKPFLVFRIISDIIDLGQQKVSYEEVLKVSSHYYSKMIAKLI